MYGFTGKEKITWHTVLLMQNKAHLNLDSFIQYCQYAFFSSNAIHQRICCSAHYLAITKLLYSKALKPTVL